MLSRESVEIPRMKFAGFRGGAARFDEPT